MLTDHWVITQLIGGSCTVILLLFACIQAVGFIRKWDKSSYSDEQLAMERKTYLLATILQTSLVFQILLLLIFLFSVNSHLPQIIKGAMCAAGTLNLNEYGYPLLFTKMIAVFIYFTFMVLNAIDNKAPDYPLTPKKYYLIFPSVVFASAELVLTVLYFFYISPDIITTCCSLSFGGMNQASFFQQNISTFSVMHLMLLHFGIFGILLLFFLWKKYILSFVASIGFLLSSYWVIKYHYIKFIYGLPSHLCLFDALGEQYNYVGIWITLGLYGLVCLNLYLILISFFEKNKTENRKTEGVLFFLFSFLALGIPMLYYLFSGHIF